MALAKIQLEKLAVHSNQQDSAAQQRMVQMLLEHTKSLALKLNEVTDEVNRLRDELDTIRR